VERRKQARGRHQHFLGFRDSTESIPLSRRGLCEAISATHAGLKRDGEIKEEVRLAHFIACGRESDYAELKRTDGRTTVLRIVWRTLPRNGGRALFLLCPHCDIPRRHV
jgi:hypothetical protein